MAKKPTKKEVIEKLAEFEIQHDPEAKYDELVALLPIEKPEFPPEVLSYDTPPCGMATMHDFEGRLRKCEHKLGLR